MSTTTAFVAFVLKRGGRRRAVGWAYKGIRRTEAVGLCMLRLHCSTSSPVGPHASQGQEAYDGQQQHQQQQQPQPNELSSACPAAATSTICKVALCCRPTAKSPPLPYEVAPPQVFLHSQDSCTYNHRWRMFSFTTVRFVHQMMGFRSALPPFNLFPGD